MKKIQLLILLVGYKALLVDATPQKNVQKKVTKLEQKRAEFRKTLGFIIDPNDLHEGYKALKFSNGEAFLESIKDGTNNVLFYQNRFKSNFLEITDSFGNNALALALLFKNDAALQDINKWQALSLSTQNTAIQEQNKGCDSIKINSCINVENSIAPRSQKATTTRLPRYSGIACIDKDIYLSTGEISVI
jgi:hypothetical protein